MVWDTLQPVVNWVDASTFARWLGQSEGRIAALFVVHLVGLTLLLGATLVIGLRLLGLGIRVGPVAQLSREIAPWQMVGLMVAMVSGSLIFAGGAVSYFEGDWFRRKMALLVLALVFNFTWFRAVAYAQEGKFSEWQKRLTAAVALLLWFGVGVAGRAIAFF